MLGRHVLVVLVACVGVYGLDWSGHEGSVQVSGVDRLAVEAMVPRIPFQHRISSKDFVLIQFFSLAVVYVLRMSIMDVSRIARRKS